MAFQKMAEHIGLINFWHLRVEIMAGESFSINPKSYLNFQGVFFYINIHKVLGEVKLFLSLKRLCDGGCAM